MNKYKLIYITNTRIPSEKANAYQSMQMCFSFAKKIADVEMWVPKARNTAELEQIKDYYKFYDIENNFLIKKFYQFDSKLLKYCNEFLWANTKSVIFAINVIINLLKIKNQKIVIYTRDWYFLKIYNFCKKIGLFNFSIYYEAHKFSNNLVDSLKNVNGLIVVTKHLKDIYQGKKVQNILVEHDGVDLKTFKLTTEIKAKKLLSLDEKTKYLVYIGRFQTLGKEKGIPEIIKSLQYIDDKVKVLFVGGPLINISSYYSIAKNYGIDHDRLIFIDRQPVSELYKYTSASAALLMPFPNTKHYSYFMSPMKMFEYMSSVRPIIASNLPSICEILTNEKNSILCEPSNSEDLAEKINFVLNNDCSKLAQQAYVDVQNFTWDNRAKRILEFIHERMN